MGRVRESAKRVARSAIEGKGMDRQERRFCFLRFIHERKQDEKNSNIPNKHNQRSAIRLSIHDLNFKRIVLNRSQHFWVIRDLPYDQNLQSHSIYRKSPNFLLFLEQHRLSANLLLHYRVELWNFILLKHYSEEPRDKTRSSIVGTKQIPLWVHLNFSPLQETSSQGNLNQTTLTQLAWPGFGP